jgi:parallel beta-helix repeat protein
MRGQTVLFTLLLLCAPLHSWATTYYVTPSGGQGGCSTNTNSPQNGLNNGMACLNGGDTLILKSGTYAEKLDDNIPSGSAGNPTTIRADVFRGAILKPNSGPSPVIWLGHFNVSSYITFDGLVTDSLNLPAPHYAVVIGPDATNNISVLNMEIRNVPNANFCSTGNNSVGISFSSSNNMVLRGNYIHNIGYDAIPEPGGACSGGLHYFYSYCTYFPANNSLVENNEFAQCSGYGFHGYGSLKNNVIRNNYFHDNGGPLYVCEPGNNQIYNNIVASNPGTYAGGAGGIIVGGYCTGSITTNAQVYNNTIVGNGGHCIQLGVSGAGLPVNNSFFQNNICYQNGTDDISVQNGSGNITNGSNLLGTNPQFVNAGGGDFHLSSGSPAEINGINLSTTFTADYAGTTRPSSGQWTRGAYTTGAPSNPVTNLFVSVQPAGGLSNTSLATWTVQARDSSNNVVTGYAGNVSIAIGTNPGNAVPSGVLSKTFTAGVASWSGLSLNKIGAGYTYVVTASTFNVITAPFNITGIAPNAPTNVRATPIP